MNDPTTAEMTLPELRAELARLDAELATVKPLTPAELAARDRRNRRRALQVIRDALWIPDPRVLSGNRIDRGGTAGT